MRVGLFIPCYVDQFYPEVGLATVEVLSQFPMVEIDYPPEQTCCGQPMANTGCLDDARPLAHHFLEVFSGYDHVVSPSGSCVSMVRNHFESFFHADPQFDRMRSRVWELCEFLSDVLQVTSLNRPFPYRVGLHSSCHGLRELRLGPCSERMVGQTDKVRQILQCVPQLELQELQRSDECCGFGGTFAVAEEGVSVLMGADRVADHLQAGVQVMTATDSSCLMHMEGIIRRRQVPLAIMHVAEILAGRALRTSRLPSGRP